VADLIQPGSSVFRYVRAGITRVRWRPRV